MSFLKAGKVDNPTGKNSQKLTACLNGRCLWTFSDDAQKIFLRAEHYFRVHTSNVGLQNINVTKIGNPI